MHETRRLHWQAFCMNVDKTKLHDRASGHIRVSEVSGRRLMALLLGSQMLSNANIQHGLVSGMMEQPASHGMLYANQTSPICGSAPTQSLSSSATAVLTAHPTRMTIVVKMGWQSNTTTYKFMLARNVYTEKDCLPRRPKPAAKPPSTFRTTHSRSSLSSSQISSALRIQGFS